MQHLTQQHRNLRAIDNTDSKPDTYNPAQHIRSGICANKPPKPNIIVPGIELAAGTLTVVFAAPGASKTWFAFDLGMRTACALPYYWQANPYAELQPSASKPRKPMHVMHIDYEVGADEMSQKQDRMLNWLRANHTVEGSAASVHELHSHYYHALDGSTLGYLTEQRAMDRLEAVLTYQYPTYDYAGKETAKLVIIDNLAAANGGDLNDNTDMTFVCNSLRRLAAKTKAAIVLLHHTPKVRQKNLDINKIDLQSLTKGSGAITAGSTCSFFLNPSRNHVDVIPVKKAYYQPTHLLSYRLVDSDDHPDAEAYRAEYAKSYGVHLESAVGEVQNEEAAAAEPELCAEMITSALAGGPLNQSKLQDALRAMGLAFSKRAFEQQITSIVAAGLVRVETGARNSKLYELATAAEGA